MKSPAELTELFRAQGLKVTPQRQCIFRTLHGNDLHPTAESVYAAARTEMPTMSLKTVYQTLNDLAAMGELQLLDLGTGSTRFDPNVDLHHHLVCTRCGKVRDLHADYRDVHVPARQRQGFTLGHAEVVFRGLCDTCSTTSPTATIDTATIDSARSTAPPSTASAPPPSTPDTAPIHHKETSLHG